MRESKSATSAIRTVLIVPDLNVDSKMPAGVYAESRESGQFL